MLKVVLASTSKIKIAAVKSAFDGLCQYELIPVKALSNINEQPIGAVEIFTGCLNRFEAAKKTIPDADVVVSIESGIELVEDSYYDYALVMISFNKAGNHNQWKVIKSASIEIPRKYVEMTKYTLGGFKNVTVGDFISSYEGWDKADDPHLFLTGKSRVDYLAETIISGL